MPSGTPELGGLPALGGAAAGWQLAQFLVASLAVIGLAFWGSRWLARRLHGMGGGRHLELLDALPVGPNRTVGLVAVAGRVLVVGVTEHHISLLATLDGADGLPAELETAGRAGRAEHREPVGPDSLGAAAAGPWGALRALVPGAARPLGTAFRAVAARLRDAAGGVTPPGERGWGRPRPAAAGIPGVAPGRPPKAGPGAARARTVRQAVAQLRALR